MYLWFIFYSVVSKSKLEKLFDNNKFKGRLYLVIKLEIDKLFGNIIIGSLLWSSNE
jgi:hypothetical protein